MPSSTFNPESLPDLTGRVYLVTGGNTGCGRWTVQILASKGAKVYMGARSQEKAAAAVEEIKAEIPSAKIEILLMDLTSFESVVAAAEKLRSKETSLHGLVNNAGVMGVPFALTKDGYEVQFQTNYLSHWLLTLHLLPVLQQTAATSAQGIVRIVNVTSGGHQTFAPKGGIVFDDLALEEEGAMTRYGQSKLANVLHTKYLHSKYGPGNPNPILMAAVHPGHIDTQLNKQATGAVNAKVLSIATPIMRCLGILVEQEKGAISSVFSVASERFTAHDSGSYVVPYAKIGTPSDYARDESLAKKLWEWTYKELSTKGLVSE